ncbi:hypothetical protein F511_10960 [Dorcoceras hygrometricum]|uniref:CCHC-type domain-containing protein n=1 Tax=Dorcoceras hygrometricum TaxID=472368 RepID=A0A2Z7B1D7_9LAMI|nr:hypothetical protein F511_10960 [Dorcoceras hygrometricum]
MKVAEYAIQFSSLLMYVPHVANQERTKRNKFLKGLRPDLFRMLLSGSPVTYAEAVDMAVDIEESLLEAQAPVQPSVGRNFQPVQDVSQSFQSPQGSQQSNRQRFKPRGKHFKKKTHSSSSGSVSSGGSSSGSMFCGQCGGKHETSQCRGVRGLCHLCGQPGNFSRACPLMGGQSLSQSQQGSAGGSSQRQQPFVPSQRSQQGVPSRLQFSGPQQAQANALTREQADEIPTGVIQGTCFFFDFPARVLIDTGASHSFISELFVYERGLSSYPLCDVVSVSTPNGVSLLSREVVLDCLIRFDEHVLMTHLIVLGIRDFDCILGMMC